METLKTLLIANRGEIACRLIRSAKRLGIKTIAIYSESDSASLHVAEADKAVLLSGEARSAYIDTDQIIQIAKDNVVDAIIPGYGFVSENCDFARQIETEGMVFVGPSAEAIEAFGLKHTARDLAIQAGVPVVPGTKGLLDTEETAVSEANRIGYPIMLKATAGGGGMGLMICDDEAAVRKNFQTVTSRGASLFKNAGVFMERYYPISHHIEVQVFGNSLGQAISVGERECSIQRRHQKVVEECPAPFVEQRFPELRKKLTECAVALAESIKYGSAGTVEYLVDDQTGDFFFLEMNTRLQVEHGITEMCYGVDLVEMMLLQADAQLSKKGGLDGTELKASQSKYLEPKGHAIEVRLYAENPARNFAPSPGLLQQVDWHEVEGTRIDTWVRPGLTITPEYDPLLAKVMQHSTTRADTIAKLEEVLSKSTVCGPPANLDFLLAIIKSPLFKSGNTSTGFLGEFKYTPAAIDVISGGSYTLVQDFPGRPSVGHGFGHSGPMDPMAFQAANVLAGNAVGTEGLELTMVGPELLFLSPAVIALCGPPVSTTVNGKEIPLWTRIHIKAGERLHVGKINTGCRVYLAVYGGLLNVATWFGSKATAPLLNVGGYQGRALRSGDFIHIVEESQLPKESATIAVPAALQPQYSHEWQIQAMPGPYETGYLSPKDIDMLYGSEWKISHNAARGGIRLIGPRPEYARESGGEGGSHPSNVIEYGYPIGGLNWTGSEPVIFPVDCPDFGGFICSLTVVTSDWWKVGQVRMGDTMRFVRADLDMAIACKKTNLAYIESLQGALASGSWDGVARFDDKELVAAPHRDNADVLHVLEPTSSRPKVSYRAGGDMFVLVDYGVGEFDLNHKCRATALKRALEARTDLCSTRLAEGGAILSTVGCGSSLMLYYDSLKLPQGDLIASLISIENELGDMSAVKLPNRTFRLPVAFKHPRLVDAIERYMTNQRSKASYLPDPFKFTAENNGITEADLKNMFLTVQSVIIGVGFFMALPLAIPADARQRLNCPKMNPSRTFTPEGTLSWGGSAIAIYAVDSPGGYMPTGMTMPTVDIFGYKHGFSAARPWLYEDMDVITYHEVTQEQYDAHMASFKSGTYEFQYEETSFDMAAHNAQLRETAAEVVEIRKKQAVAQRKMEVLEKELFNQWIEEKKAGEPDLDTVKSLLDDPQVEAIEAPVSANVWKVTAEEGTVLQAGQRITILEAMKMEIEVAIPDKFVGAKLERILIAPGDTVESGQPMAVVRLPQ